MKQLLWVTFGIAIGVLSLDWWRLRAQESEWRSTINQAIELNERRGETVEACISSLVVCRAVVAEHSTEGVKLLATYEKQRREEPNGTANKGQGRGLASRGEETFE